MGKKVVSLDLTLRGVTQSFEFDEPEAVENEDETSIGQELLSEVQLTELELVDETIRSARVEVNYTYHFQGTVTVDLDDVEAVDRDDLVYQVAAGEFDEVSSSIEEDIAENFDSYAVSLDGVGVEEALDANGEDVEV